MNIRTTHEQPLNPKLWHFLEKQRNLFWLPKHPDLSLDLADLKSMPKEWSHFAKFLSAFFAVSDALVNVSIESRLEYFVDKYAPNLKLELKYNWHFQEMMEDIHAEQYSLFLETYCIDTEEKQRYINCIENFPTIRAKAEFILSIQDNNNPLCILIACACVERIMFSGSFAGVFWFKTKNLLAGFIEANSYIIRDEGIHCDILTTTFNLLVEENPSLLNDETRKLCREIVTYACTIEKQFAVEALPQPLPGMNYDLMSQYIEYIGDHLLDVVGIAPVYHSENPFPFMDMISLETKTSFFEKKVTEYKKAETDNSGFVEDDTI
jgi:ribonucleoside-diphosphate reductase beta chain